MKARTARAPGEVRIIGGLYKRTRLPVLDRPGLRPTPDRVRETLFNWLGQDLGGWRCMDVFAGSGALGLEAASRGAAQVLLVEQDALLARQIGQLAERLRAAAVQVRRGDGLSELARCAPASLDLVLLDPPFDTQALLPAALKSAARALAPGGWIYLEAGRRWDAAALQPAGLVCQRYLKAGAAHAHLLQSAPESY
ncbi:16S rRNA (guanine(966)-N(2))-methyltransferase RsmD [Comamonas flocculans]|uniref:16S rRNA (Guanine(966)-N(2))-methyltransferase RsmD n=1 Tax=Comamonas flocculans TaxID=2597701 RepID=A0A5B8RVL2_9BURK|nr:16S rRNA (guanine(966)-N(2))-methyltransferase RsmD [Comamonas flocculans]QEA13639.1 16S rRNA (guanine(966)-N(2))-methyltransferase RsmD [Comamonas flocculans]